MLCRGLRIPRCEPAFLRRFADRPLLQSCRALNRWTPSIQQAYFATSLQNSTSTITSVPKIEKTTSIHDVSLNPRFRYRLIIEFDGSAYHGWAKQPANVEGNSVHEALVRAAHRFAVRQSDIFFYTAGRTDSGVHALALVAHVDFDQKYHPETVLKALNSFLRKNSEEICIVHAEEVPSTFHARFGALERRYIYLVQQRSMGGLNRLRAWHLGDRLKVDEMHRASQLLVGTWDFSTLRSTHCSASSPVRTINAISVTSIPGGQLMLNVRAPSFIMHQVRSIMGCLAQVGTGKWSIEEFEHRVRSCDRKLCAPVAPPHGLYFAGVRYADFNTDFHRSLLFGEIGLG